MRILTITAALMLAGLAQAQEYEIEISFYLQPDSSGDKTENRSIELEDGEIVIEGHNAVESMREERNATPEEIAFLTELTKAQFADITLEAGPEIDYPYIEVQFEFDGNDVSMEIEHVFAIGTVPADLVDLQNRFFAGAFE